MGMTNKKRTRDICFIVSHPGDDTFKQGLQQSVLTIPARNNDGAEQHITFPAIANQPADVKEVALAAKSDAKVRVYYYVREGPAEVQNDQLEITPIPPNTNMPIKVTVVAWQFGRGTEPKLKTADPVERSFWIGSGARPDDRAQRDKIWADASAQVKAIELARQQAAERAVQAAKDAPPALGLNVCKSVGMRPEDLAGAEVRVGNWNNFANIKANSTVELASLVDKDGKPVPGASARVIFGSSPGPSGAFDADTGKPGPANDARLFNGLFDGDERGPTVLEVTGIPYARYDVYCYRADDSEDRASLFQIGDEKLSIRGGAWNPEEDGTEYVRSHGNLERGNYVKFKNVTGPTLKVSCVAIAAGDPVMRNKIVGFQIVDRSGSHGDAGNKK
jgi:hypothetical protein